MRIQSATFASSATVAATADPVVPGAIAFESVWDRPVSALDGAGLIERLRILDRERRRIEAELGEVISEVDRRQAYLDDGHTTVHGWCRVPTRWSRFETAARVQSAALLHSEPSVAEALATGVLGVAQCHEMARASANPRCGHRFHEVVAILLHHAERLPFEEFRLVVRRWEQLADADGAHRHHEQSQVHRRASLHVDGDAMHLQAFGGAVAGAEMSSILQRYVDAEFRDDCEAARVATGSTVCGAHLERTAQQRTFDALYRIFIDAASTPAGAQRPEPVLNLVCDVDAFERILGSLTMVDSAPADHAHPERAPDPRWWRCETESGAPVTSADVIHAALVGHVRRVVFDGAGVVVDVGRRRRCFTGPMRDAVLLLSLLCTWPGCSRASGQSEADHTIDHRHGGSTSASNGGPLCGHHNRCKNRGFEVWRDPDGYWHTYRPDGSEII